MQIKQHKLLETFVKLQEEYTQLCDLNEKHGILKQILQDNAQLYKLNFFSETELKEAILKKTDEVEYKLHRVCKFLKNVIKTEANAEEKHQRKLLKQKQYRLALKLIPTCALAFMPCVALATVGGLIANSVNPASTQVGIFIGAINGAIYSGTTIGFNCYFSDFKNKLVNVLSLPGKPFVKTLTELNNCDQAINQLNRNILTRLADENLPKTNTDSQKCELSKSDTIIDCLTK